MACLPVGRFASPALNMYDMHSPSSASPISCVDRVQWCMQASVSGLDNFRKFLATNLPTKAAQIIHDILGYFEKHLFKYNLCVFGLLFIPTSGRTACKQASWNVCSQMRKKSAEKRRSEFSLPPPRETHLLRWEKLIWRSD